MTTDPQDLSVPSEMEAPEHADGPSQDEQERVVTAEQLETSGAAMRKTLAEAVERAGAAITAAAAAVSRARSSESAPAPSAPAAPPAAVPSAAGPG